MFSITKKSRYAIAALVELTKNSGGAPLKSKDLAIRCNIPKQFLDQILCRLRESGFVQSVHGAKGGYILNMRPEYISMIKIIETLDGAVSMPLESNRNDVVAELFQEVEYKAKEILSVSLAELGEKQKRRHVVFHI